VILTGRKEKGERRKEKREKRKEKREEEKKRGSLLLSFFFFLPLLVCLSVLHKPHREKDRFENAQIIELH
jgi:hypothetical protein